MILEEGYKVLVVYRRLYAGDECRFFTGVVDGYESGIVKVSGYSWMTDQFTGTVIEKAELRTKVFSIASGTLIVYQLPNDVDPKRLGFEKKPNGELWLTDGSAFKMNLTEREYHHPQRRGR